MSAITKRPWLGRDWNTNMTMADYEEQLKDCEAPDWAKRAAVSIVRSYGITGICDPAYIANIINTQFKEKDNEAAKSGRQ